MSLKLSQLVVQTYITTQKIKIFFGDHFKIISSL